jgi:hypothetical protein
MGIVTFNACVRQIGLLVENLAMFLLLDHFNDRPVDRIANDLHPCCIKFMAGSAVFAGSVPLKLQGIGKGSGSLSVGKLYMLVCGSVTTLASQSGMMAGTFLINDILVAFPASRGPGIMKGTVGILGERKPPVMTVFPERFWNEQIACDKKQGNDHRKREEQASDVLRHNNRCFIISYKDI